jgi:hypothetical protein
LTRHNLQLQQQSTVFDSSPLLTYILHILRSATCTTVAATIAAVVIPTTRRLRARCHPISYLQAKTISIISTALSPIITQFRQQPHTVPIATMLGGTDLTTMAQPPSNTAQPPPTVAQPHTDTAQPSTDTGDDTPDTRDDTLDTIATNSYTTYDGHEQPPTDTIATNSYPTYDGHEQPLPVMAQPLPIMTEQTMLQHSQLVQLHVMISRSYVSCSDKPASRLATTSTSPTEQVVLQHTQPIQRTRLATTSISSTEQVVLQHTQPTQQTTYHRSYASYDQTRLTTTSTSPAERVVLQHSQPTQYIIHQSLYRICSHPFAVFRHISNTQSAVSLSEPAQPTSSSSIFATSLLAPSRLEIGSTVLGSCGFSELLFGTAGPPPDYT